MRITKENLGIEFTQFVNTYEKCSFGLNKNLPSVINLIECSSSDYISKYAKNCFLTNFDRDIASPFFMTDDSFWGKDNEFSVYRITDWCTELSIEDNNALLLHEFGHIQFKILKETCNTNEEEYADKFASKIIGKEIMKHALNTLLYISPQNNQIIMNRIKHL